MLIDQFHTTVHDQLVTLGGSVGFSVKPETRGYTLTLHVADGAHASSKFYTETDVMTYSPQLVRVQVCHLYNQLIQRVVDATLGKGVMHVR